MTFIYETPPTTPLSDGLYRAAKLIEIFDPDRLWDGLELRSFNCQPGYGIWHTDVCFDDPGNPTKTGDRTPTTLFDGFAVWAADACFPQDEETAIAAAFQTLRMHEQELVEAEFATRLLADAGVIAAPANGEPEEFVRAVGEIEAELGNLPGVIHADAKFQAWAHRYGLTNGAGRTPRGRLWAFGAGYGALGNNLIGTGPVTVHRSELNSFNQLEWQRNTRLVVVERSVAVSYECGITARNVDVVV